VTFQSFDYLSLLCTPGCYYLVTYIISLIYSHIDLINFHCFIHTLLFFIYLQPSFTYKTNRIHSFIHATEFFTIHTDNLSFINLIYFHSLFIIHSMYVIMCMYICQCMHTCKYVGMYDVNVCMYAYFLRVIIYYSFNVCNYVHVYQDVCIHVST